MEREMLGPGGAAANPPVMETEEVDSLASFLQVHDSRLGRFEFEAQLSQDHRERHQSAVGLPLGLAQRPQIIGVWCPAQKPAQSSIPGSS